MRPATPRDKSAQERILGAAERLFSERGYENVSVRDIAEAAGVTHPLIYYHWASKRELLAAVVASTQERMRGTAAAAHMAGGGDAAQQVRDLIGSLVQDGLSDNRPYFIMLTRAFLDGMPAGDWPGGNPGADASVRLLLQAGPHEDPVWEERVRASVAVVSALVTGWILLEDQLLDIVDLPPSGRGTARKLLLDAVDRVIGNALEPLPAPGDEPS